LVTKIVIKIIGVTITMALVEGVRVPSLLLLLWGPVPIVVVVVVDEAHFLLCLGAIITRVIASSAHLTPGVGCDGLYGGIRLDGLLL